MTPLMETMIVLFGMMILGFIIYKFNIIDDVANRKISKLIVEFTSPCLILSSVLNKGQGSSQVNIFKVMALGFGIYFAMIVFARIIIMPFKGNKDEKSVYQLILVFANVSFVGYPVIRSLFGEGSIFVSTILNLPFNILIYSYGAYMLQEYGTEKLDIKKLISPGIVASIVALIIYITHIDAPHSIKEILSLIGNATIPLSMLVIGSSLASIDLEPALLSPKILAISVIKLIIMPVIGFFIMNIITDNVYIINLVVINLSLPAGAMVGMMATEYNGDSKTASVGIFLTTLISMGTIPLISHLLIK